MVRLKLSFLLGWNAFELLICPLIKAGIFLARVSKKTKTKTKKKQNTWKTRTRERRFLKPRISVRSNCVNPSYRITLILVSIQPCSYQRNSGKCLCDRMIIKKKRKFREFLVSEEAWSLVWKLTSSTMQFAIRSLMNLPKTTPYGDLLKMVNIKSQEHRRYTQALILLYKSLFITGPSYIKELFSLRSSNYDLRGYCKLNQPTFKSKCLHNSYRYITSRLWNNLSDNIRGASSLTIFKNLLNNDHRGQLLL